MNTLVDNLPSFEDVVSAAAQIKGEAVRTPLLYARHASELLGRPIYVKPECLQRTGSFKFRGAFNRISRFTPEEAKAGVIAVSSGNHAQGVAAAASLLGISAKIVMPADAPTAKISGTKGYGADVVFFDRKSEDREELVAKLAREDGRVFVAPYENFHVMAGQGTIGLEIAEDASGLGIDIDAVLAPTGGGGLLAGISLAFSELLPTSKIFGVEPAGFDDLKRSLETGERQRNAKTSGSICDAILAPTPGEATFAINRRLVDGIFVVSDEEAGAAVAHGFEALKLVIEPGGAVALAAVLESRIPPGDGAVVAVLSGGNIDAELFASLTKYTASA